MWSRDVKVAFKMRLNDIASQSISRPSHIKTTPDWTAQARKADYVLENTWNCTVMYVAYFCCRNVPSGRTNLSLRCRLASPLASRYVRTRNDLQCVQMCGRRECLPRFQSCRSYACLMCARNIVSTCTEAVARPPRPQILRGSSRS